MHATWVLVVVAVLPFLLSGIWDADLTHPLGARANTLSLHEMLIMAVWVLLGWRFSKWVGMFGRPF